MPLFARLRQRMRRPAGRRAEFAHIRDGRDITRGQIRPRGTMFPQDPVLRNRDGIASMAGYVYDAYIELLTDPAVSASLAKRREAQVARILRVTPGGTRAIDRQAAESIEEMLHNIRLADIIRKMHYAFWNGYAVGEAIYARDGRKVALVDIKVRDIRRFGFDQRLRLKMKTLDEPNGEFAPENKFWILTTGAIHDDEPYGWGLASACYWPVQFKRSVSQYWLGYLADFGAPTFVASYEDNVSDEGERAALSAAQAAVENRAVAKPKSLDLEVMESDRNSSGEYHEMFDRENRDIVNIIIGRESTNSERFNRSGAGNFFGANQRLDPGQITGGVDEVIVGGDAKSIWGSFTHTIADWLTGWNYPGAETPIIESIDAREELAGLQRATESGQGLQGDPAAGLGPGVAGAAGAAGAPGGGVPRGTGNTIRAVGGDQQPGGVGVERDIFGRFA